MDTTMLPTRKQCPRCGYVPGEPFVCPVCDWNAQARSALVVAFVLLAGCSVSRSGLGQPEIDAPDAAQTPDSALPFDYDGGVFAPDANLRDDTGTAVTPDAGTPEPDAGTPDSGTSSPDSGLGHDAGTPPPSCMPDETALLGACWSKLLTDDTTGTGGYARCIFRGGQLAEWRSTSEQNTVRATLVPVFGGGLVGLRHESDGHWHWISGDMVADGQIAWAGGAPDPAGYPLLDSSGLHAPLSPPDGYLCRRAP